MGIGRVTAAPGAQRRSVGFRFQHQYERKIGRVDDEGLLGVWPEPRENIGSGSRNLRADESENRLQQRKGQEAKQRKRPRAISCERRSQHAISVAPRYADGNSATRSLESFLQVFSAHDTQVQSHEMKATIRRCRLSSAAPADGFPPATTRWFANGSAPPANARTAGSPPRSPVPAPRLRGQPVRSDCAPRS